MGYRHEKFKPRKNPEFAYWEHDKCTITLTKEILGILSSIRGGFRMDQLRVIKENRTTGWLKRMTGLKITQEQYDKMLSLRDPITQKEAEDEIREDRRLISERNKAIKEAREKRMTVKGHNGTYYDYLQSFEWSEIRRELFESRGEKCELCGNLNRLQIHHITYARLFNEDPADLQILCVFCHKRIHGIGKNGKKIGK